jgi:hypothetical protein
MAQTVLADVDRRHEGDVGWYAPEGPVAQGPPQTVDLGVERRPKQQGHAQPHAGHAGTSSCATTPVTHSRRHRMSAHVKCNTLAASRVMATSIGFTVTSQSAG